MKRVAARMLLTLMAPQRPLSVVISTITARLPSRRIRNGWRYSVARSVVVCRTSTIFSAYGRAACTACCARRSLVAATTCIALVIFCVFLMESMRRTMSLYAGMGQAPSTPWGKGSWYAGRAPSPPWGEGSGVGAARSRHACTLLFLRLPRGLGLVLQRGADLVQL